MFQELVAQSEQVRDHYSLLEKWMKERPHIPIPEVLEAVDGILVSFKSGKRVSTLGKRYTYRNGRRKVAQEGIVVPRGSLSEESVYGAISCLEEKVPVKRLFEHPETIFKQYIREKVEDRISEHDGNYKTALKSLKKNPIYLGKNNTKPLEFATCWKKEYVIRYPIASIKKKDVEYIVDQHIRQLVNERIEAVGEKDAFKEPLYADMTGKMPVMSVRLFTKLNEKAVAPVKYSDGDPIGFVKPGNNHHIALYRDSEGRLSEHVVSFWHAVERKKYGIPVIIEDTDVIWDEVANRYLPEAFLNNLPAAGLKLAVSLQQNEMFILGMPEEEYRIAIKDKDYRLLNKYLYRVQKVSSGEYCFRYHVETVLDDSTNALNIHKLYRVQSIGAYMKLNPHKVRVNVLGEISEP